jgi:hypothetical protein
MSFFFANIFLEVFLVVFKQTLFVIFSCPYLACVFNEVPLMVEFPVRWLPIKKT